MARRTSGGGGGSRRSRRSPALEGKWRRLIRTWEESGQTVRGFCRTARLSEASFYSWRRELARRDGTRRRGASANTPSFVEVVPVAASPSTVFEIVLEAGARIRVGEHFDTEGLVLLISAVRRGLAC